MSDYAKFLQIAEDFQGKLKNASSSEDLLAKSWKRAFLIVLLNEHVDAEIDLAKALKMAIVADLAEGLDTKNFECESEKAKRKALKAYVRELLEDDTIYRLYKELQKNETLEARFVNSLNGNFEEEEYFWEKKDELDEDFEDEETEDEEPAEEEIEEDEECCCDGECEDHKDMGSVYEHLNKIADILKIDFRKKDKEKHKDKDKDKKEKHKDKDKDKKHKDKDEYDEYKKWKKEKKDQEKYKD